MQRFVCFPDGVIVKRLSQGFYEEKPFSLFFAIKAHAVLRINLSKQIHQVLIIRDSIFNMQQEAKKQSSEIQIKQKSGIWTKVDNTPIIPITLKIIVLFTIVILVSNLTTNYINLIFNRTELINQKRELLAKDLKEIFTYASNQYEIYNFTKNIDSSLDGIVKKAKHELDNKESLLLAIKEDGTFLLQAAFQNVSGQTFDKALLGQINANRAKNIEEAFVHFRFGVKEYFGVYKYNSKWGAYFIRAEELNEFYAKSRQIFRDVSLIIIGITVLIAIFGIFILRYIVRFIPIITGEIMKMIKNQQLGIIDLRKAPNDDITYLGMAFNSLSSTINNLLSIFRKFANRDIVIKAYREREIRLEGTPKDLAILFSDIKSFTFITEILGTDIIRLLNLHYDRAIREVIKYDGVIGSIIGDALLAVYGAIDDSEWNKSMASVESAYRIQDVAESLRQGMTAKKMEIEKEKGKLTPEEERVYQAVLLEVGIGIDGGEVFYGTIGSYERMTNTVIGDNVNSSSRLEGLTRVYKIPVICSEYIKEDIEKNVANHGIQFVEIDTVQVKGKTIGKKIFWPVPKAEFKKLEKDLQVFSLGLREYYDGNWKEAYGYFQKCKLNLAKVFLERTHNATCPKDWNGIWQMTSK